VAGRKQDIGSTKLKDNDIMQINSTMSQAGSMIQNDTSRFSKIKQSFDDLGSALESGNLADAKDALAQLQKNAPKSSGKANDPMGSKLDALSQALKSGDLKAAQQAYSDIKNTMAQNHAARTGGAGGPPPGGAPPTQSTDPASASASSPNSNKVCDKMDANKDGVVSAKEKSDYLLSHPNPTNQHSTSASIDSDRGLINALA